MKFAKVTDRLKGLGSDKWAVHYAAREMIANGIDVLEIAIGEPDVDIPNDLVETAISAMQSGRTKYANGIGELNLRQALADDYTKRHGRNFDADNVMCVPGTQTALYVSINGVAGAGDEVLVGDPLYATYESVIQSSGADLVRVPLKAEHGFRLQVKDIEDRLTDKTRALLLNSPHNPTGSILTKTEIDAIVDLAIKHDFWIISDEVYADMVFEGETFVSPLSRKDAADRVVGLSSISKSHAAPGFRSGWCVGSKEFVETVVPLSETMLFGNQPFIADMTEKAVADGSAVAAGMRERFSARAKMVASTLGGNNSPLKVHQPQAGMFSIVDVSGTGQNGYDFAMGLLQQEKVAVMPGTSFGEGMTDWIRISLTVDDDKMKEAMTRISRFCDTLNQG